MKIAINCMYCTPQGGGIKEYIVNLTHSLAFVDCENEYLLYVFENQLDYTKNVLPQNHRIKVLPYKSSLISKIYRSLFSQRFWYKEEAKECFDIFHSPHFHAPKFKKAKVILTVHDLRLYRFPWTYNIIRLIYLYPSVKTSIKRADAIISVSQFTKDEIVDTCKVSPDKITVIHEAINREDFSCSKLENYSLPTEYNLLKGRRFLFTLSHIEKRKNYPRLLEAFKMLKCDEKNRDLILVVAGRLNMRSKKILHQIEKANDVVYLNFIPRELLLWLYKNTTLFILPSYYEGFGFPPLEAASMGTVSAVSNVSSIPEVCGDCAFYFDPFNPQNICDVISSCLNHPEMIEEKKKLLESQLNSFSWVKNAESTLKVYKRLCHIKS